MAGIYSSDGQLITSKKRRDGRHLVRALRFEQVVNARESAVQVYLVEVYLLPLNIDPDSWPLLHRSSQR